MTELAWGRRYLLCPPQHFGVLYEINPWMHRQVEVDRDRAAEQHALLSATLHEAGAEVVMVDQAEPVPDMVFTANAGLVSGRTFVPSIFRHPERQPETPVFTAWFETQGFDIAELPDGLTHEGAGDALPFGDPPVLLSGYRPRSDATAGTELSRLLGCPVRSVELVDERLYHIDLTFCPLDDGRALCAPLGWDAYGRRVVQALVPEPLWLTDDEALSFCANSVVVDRTVLMPVVPPRVGKQLEAWGFEVVEVAVTEFLKAGGGCRCLTLALDVELSR
ncbi:MAG: dimethylarginine dimethylaminohydrolase family protein [Acidimicrobiales bacterium]